jgi:hypothetical protein
VKKDPFFIDAFVVPGSGGLAGASGLVFFTPVPEPATLTLLGIATFGLLGCVWRRKQRAA